MKEVKNWLNIAVRGTVLIYLPLALLFYWSYQSVFSMGPGIHWIFIVLYLLVFLRWLIAKYRHQCIEEEVQSFDSLDRLIEQGRFEVLDKRQAEMTVRPTFDTPFNLILDDKIDLYYADESLRIEGPKHYITILSKNIRGEESLWTRKSMSSLKFIYMAFIVLLPVLMDSNLVWSMNVLRHNTFSSVSEEVEAVSETVSGNALENTMNGGYAVETDEYTFYVEDHMDLVRTDKQFENAEYLIQREGGHGIRNLNVVGEWLYFTKGETIERMKLDGSEHTTLFSLSFPSEMQIYGNGIYFSTWQDDNSIYRMDLNGQNLEQLIDIRAYSFSIHDDRLLVSHEKQGQAVVESFDLNGEDPEIVLDSYAENLMVWDGYYYYLGDESLLYRSEIGEDSDPELLVDTHVSAYMPTEQGVVFALSSLSEGYSGEGIYMMSTDGGDEELLSASSSVEGLAKVGDAVLFTVEESYGEHTLKRIDLESGRTDVLESAKQ
ncbi:DUF5050 domain-containing protein [Alkalibacterium putridalgicola]|uniref:DUF5050 domain-containing protein n=1 Tax=Alkalibacterium putridalgicola TaxID=426703 RepID=UPI0034CF41E8